MLTIQQIKADPQLIIERPAVKGFKGEKPIARVLALDDLRRGLQLKTTTPPPNSTAWPPR